MDVQMKLANNAFATRENYIRGVRALILHYQRLPEQCSVHEIKAFLVHQRDDQQYSSSTVNLRVCASKYYFREVLHRLDLVVKIPNPRVSKFDVEVLTIEEIK
ncbi:MAG: phage integrase N-terminal SAM-like domain-containing protein, partial [Bacteroidota bacterium]